MIGEVVGKEGRVGSQCKKVVALHFSQKIAIDRSNDDQDKVPEV